MDDGMMQKQTRLRTIRLLFVAAQAGLALAGCSSPGTVPAVTPSQSLPVPAGLRDFRYCEVIPVFQQGLSLHVEVYNTLGLNDCPADAWAKLDAAAMAKQFGARLVKLNGPRHWVIDRLVGSGATASGKVADFGGIQMRQVATLQTKLWQGTVGDKFYAPNEVHRNTVWTYGAGRLVYELVGPKGEVYMMQSYAQIVDPGLTLAALEHLGSRLKLPAGWHYRTRKLDADVELKADGLAYVINDDLYNSYQRVMK
jgi:hypothetical protein